MSYEKELEAAKKAALMAGRVAMKFYGKELGVELKDGDSPVTKADLAAEKVIFDMLRDSNYGLLSEESEEENDRLYKERVWIIDPLDGTKGFIEGMDEFAIMIGLSDNGKSVVGVVYNPASKIMYFASKGGGAYIQEADNDPQEIQVSDAGDFKDVRLLISRHHLLDLERNLAEKLNFKDKVFGTGAGLKAATVCSGKAELYINSSDRTGQWDICASDIIVREAGGKLTDMGGQEIVYNVKEVKNLNGFVISNGKIHERIIEEIAKEK
jgi:3'(2'), 5'-bisphosphate nucleotidase